MKASDFRVAADARRAAEGQLSFFRSMMAAKTANKSGATETKTQTGSQTKSKK